LLLHQDIIITNLYQTQWHWSF